MSAPVRFVYDPALADYELAPDHPFRPERLELTRSLLAACVLLDPSEETAPPPLPATELERIHEPPYLTAVRTASEGAWRPELLAFGLGTGDNPVWPSMHEAVLGVVGATVAAAELVASGAATRAVNLSGGLHHAHDGRASGFCVYSDLGLAIHRLVDDHDLRVAYLDLDAHHGDGVQWLFYDEPRVLTLSLHQDGRTLFPGTGHIGELGEGRARGTSLNVPLAPHSADADLLDALERVAPAALRAFAPDLIVLQAGADMHHHDPLAQLDISLTGMQASYRRVVELADEHCGGRLVATGGGGYDPYRTVPRAWSHLWAALTGRELPERLPDAWRERWQPLSDVTLPTHALDDPGDWPQRHDAERIAEHDRAVVDRLLEAAEPLWRGPAFPGA